MRRSWWETFPWLLIVVAAVAFWGAYHLLDWLLATYTVP